ncbi:SusC/RagA family TonB-linked outer membrane protein [Mangrovibacterium marinum]|uniref:TonB-linked SusC/RagA family outer membrane protein n=1 Tax=Mangrovibacterium marinum TaxID=1639118 RepID=A0A2T5C4M8_9BACT|nr:SusC/RagA family TonB-linked outer membrane protein [Mangrovibacterium marinum]PTN09804.1 TonB-linked SusC/RagA family outer membrane protein [Mangrovibacterium marinum]
MEIVKTILSAIFLFIVCEISAQSTVVKGRVLDADQHPVENAIIGVTGEKTYTNESGEFELTVANTDENISVSAAGFYNQVQPLKGRTELELTLISKDKIEYTESVLNPHPYFRDELYVRPSFSVNKENKDFGKSSYVDNNLQGEFAGLRVVRKSGMPGEGAYLNLRGVRSFVGKNMPLIVLNGVPYMPDSEDSPIIGGYSAGLLNSIDASSIRNITVLKGGEAALYGSLGSNGVILIETTGSDSENMDTKITFSGQYGVNWNSKRIPMMGVDDYKGYISDLGMDRYDNMNSILSNYPFLRDDPDYYYNYLYNNNTDWQDLIYSPSFVTDNVIRVNGGDAVAKYDLSLGYMGDGGVMDNTNINRYHTQIGAKMMITRKLEMDGIVRLAYLTGDMQEQGMLYATNPALAAYRQSPVLSPYKKMADNSLLNDYAEQHYGVSNPLALVNTLSASNRSYDVNLKVKLNYALTKNLDLSGIIGLMYNYKQESIFVPGRTSNTVVESDYGRARNIVRSAVGDTKNMYYNLNANYRPVLGDKHSLNVYGGVKIYTLDVEYDAGQGYNTASDFYKTLDYVTSDYTRIFMGYIDEWRWMNCYAHADYVWNDLLKGSVNLAVDRASSAGTDASKIELYPSVGLTFMPKNFKSLLNSSFLNRMNLGVEYSVTGNSMFSSNYGKNYYSSVQVMQMSGLVRSGIPNTKLGYEQTEQFNVELDLALLRNRFDLMVNYYDAKTSDVIIAQPTSAVYGTDSFLDNTAVISNRGVELSFNASLIRANNFEWSVGGNIAKNMAKVKSLGDAESMITTLDDGAQIITKVGENPYSFYGYKQKGIFSTSEAATEANLSNRKGDYFGAGDVHFEDVDGDHVIDNNDKQIIGSAAPDYFGGFYSTVKYKNFSLSVDFVYSVGNDAYNAVRRSNESMSNFYNGSVAVANRWRYEGQVTDMPRASYGDPLGNTNFSSRWVEQASYLKLKNVTLNYDFDQSILGFFQAGQIYVTAENLFTWTKYLGLDPEFSYSHSEMLQGVDYAKVVLPRTAKIGVNLKF